MNTHTQHLRNTLACMILGGALLALSLPAASAEAVVARIHGHAYGLLPVKGVNVARLPAVKRALRSSGSSATGPSGYDKAGQLSYHGGAVMHSVRTHVIYWDPSGEFTETTKGIVKSFFTDVAHDSGLASNVFGVGGQYGDGSGHTLYSSTFEGGVTDNTPFPVSGCTIPNEFDKSAFYSHCITDEQLQTRLSSYVTAHSLPRGSGQQYFVLLPHNVVTCLPEEEVEVEPGVFIKFQPCSNNVFCAYHSSIEGNTPNEIIYSDIPFSLLDTVEHAKACQEDGHPFVVQHPNGDTGGGLETTKFADVALKYTSHEYIEAATDPIEGGGWWENANGQEIGDKCNFAGGGFGLGEDPNAFAPTLGGEAAGGTLFNQSISSGNYYLQSEWDNAGKACLMRPMPLSGAGFNPPPGNAGSPVGFNGGVADPYGQPAFTWSFGDGGTAAGSSPAHTYGAAGVYTVTMSTRDALTGSTTAPVEHTVVIGEAPKPPPPAAPAPVTATTAVVAPPNSSFGALKATINAKTGVITFTTSVGDPGTFSWLFTFQNGKFGVFAASTAKCKKGLVRLNGRCRPAKIVFAKGSKLVAAPGTVSFTVKPSPSALKALRNALKQNKGLPVSATFTFQSSRGGSPVVHAQSLMVKLKKK